MAYPTAGLVNNYVYKNHIYDSANGVWNKLGSKALTAKIYMSANHTLVANAWGKLPFNVVSYSNLHGTYDTANYRFIPAVSGVFRALVSGYSSTTYATANRYAIGLYKNGINQGFCGGIDNTLADVPLSGMTGEVQMNGTTDYIEIWMFSANAGTLPGGSGNSGGHEMIWNIEFVGR